MRHRIRTSLKGSWSDQDLHKAILLIKEGVPLRKAAQSCNIPAATLCKRMKDGEIDCGPKFGRTPVLLKDHEDELVARLIYLSETTEGITVGQIQKLAFVIAEEHNLKHNFNKETRTAGKDWLRNFLQRHPQIRNNIKKIAVDNIDLLPGKIIQKEAAKTWCIESKDVDRFRKVIYYQRKKLRNKLKRATRKDEVSGLDSRKYSSTTYTNADSDNMQITHDQSSFGGSRTDNFKMMLHLESGESTNTTLHENKYSGQLLDDSRTSDSIADFEDITGCNGNHDVKYEPSFPVEEEKSMVEKLLQLIDESGIEMSSEEIRRFAFYYAWFYNLPNNFDKKTKLAGEEWYLQLTSRYPEIIPVSERSIELADINAAKSRTNSEDNRSDLPATKKRKRDGEFSRICLSTEDLNSSEFLDGNFEDENPIVKAEPLDFYLECEKDQDSTESYSIYQKSPNSVDPLQNITSENDDDDDDDEGDTTNTTTLCHNKQTDTFRPKSKQKRKNIENYLSMKNEHDCNRKTVASIFHPGIDLSHPIDSFFHSIAQMVKKLKLVNQIRVKQTTSNIVMELELEEACGSSSS